MKSWTRYAGVLVLVVTVGALSPATATQLIVNAEAGVTQRSFGEDGAIGVDQLTIVWRPEMDPDEATYELIGACDRMDPFGNLYGEHTAVYSRIQMMGFDSARQQRVSRRMRIRVRDGETDDSPGIDVTEMVRSRFAQEQRVMLQAKVRVTGQARVGDTVTCVFAIVEMHESVLRTVSAAEKEAALRSTLAKLSPTRRPAEVR